MQGRQYTWSLGRSCARYPTVWTRSRRSTPPRWSELTAAERTFRSSTHLTTYSLSTVAMTLHGVPHLT